MIYSIIFIILSFCSIYYYRRPNCKSFKRAYSLLFIIFVIIAGLRYELGMDYFAYRQAFIDGDSISTLFINYSSFADFFSENLREPGYLLLSIILRTFTSEVQLLFFVVSIFTTFALFKCIECLQDRKLFFLTLLCYFCFVYMYLEMQATRQAIGNALFLIGIIKYSENQRKNILFIYICLAVFFHYSFLIILILFPLLDYKFNIRFKLCVLIGSFFVFIFRLRWLTSTLVYLSYALGSGSIGNKVSNYAFSKVFNERDFFITIFLYIIVYIVYTVYYSRIKSENKIDVLIDNLSFYFLLSTLLLWEFSILSMRTSWLFIFGFVMCLSRLIVLFKKNIRGFVFICVLFFNFILLKDFMFNLTITVLPFCPYQDYVSYTLFDRKSSGLQRANSYAREVGAREINE